MAKAKKSEDFLPLYTLLPVNTKHDKKTINIGTISIYPPQQFVNITTWPHVIRGSELDILLQQGKLIVYEGDIHKTLELIANCIQFPVIYEYIVFGALAHYNICIDDD